jgi:hypothetical protein
VTNWLKIAVYSLVTLAVLWLGWLAASKMVSSIDYRNSDFVSYYLAGLMTLQRRNPYVTEQWIAGYHLLNATWIPNPIFQYPLPLAILLTPLGLLDLYSAFVLWLIISGVLIGLVCTGWIALQKVKKRAAYLLPLLAGAFLFRPTLVTFHDGQLGAFLLFIIASVALIWTRGAWFYGGLMLGFTMLKPSVGFPLLAFTGIWLVFQRRYAALAGLIASGLCLAILGSAWDSNWPTDFLSNSNKMLAEFFGISASLWGVSGAICRYQADCARFLGGLMAAGFSAMIILFLWTKRRTLDPLAALGITSAAAVIVTPYIWAYDQILTLIAVIATMTIAIRKPYAYLAIASYPILIAMMSAALLLIAMRVGRDHWSVLMPLASLATLIVVLQRQDFRPYHPG